VNCSALSGGLNQKPCASSQPFSRSKAPCARGKESGLANQGWKDSQDSIFHADGRFPTGPIAVVEVQGYVYAAFLAMAELASTRREETQAQGWRTRAQKLRAAIERQFWCPDLDAYAIALDGAGSPCRIRASNMGHLLYCGVPGAERGKRVIAQLLSPRLASGWGARTLASAQSRFNPMSYHNGSVWPHDAATAYPARVQRPIR
jgi:glycogen debranching enzyme